MTFTPCKEAYTYTANPGGAPANVAVSVSRNGLKAGFLGMLGNDDFGKRLQATLIENKVKPLSNKLTDEAVTTSDEELFFVGGENNIDSFMDEYKITAVIETLGSKGSKYYYNGKSGVLESMKVKAVDATGAGDAFWGGFLSNLVMQKVTSVADINEVIIEAALKYGNTSGGLCVTKMGGIPGIPTKEDIYSAMLR